MARTTFELFLRIGLYCLCVFVPSLMYLQLPVKHMVVEDRGKPRVRENVGISAKPGYHQQQRNSKSTTTNSYNTNT